MLGKLGSKEATHALKFYKSTSRSKECCPQIPAVRLNLGKQPETELIAWTKCNLPDMLICSICYYVCV